MQRPWVLELTKPSGAPATVVGGLTVPLRLSLDAQWAGASAVVMSEHTRDLGPLLRDTRLKIPVLEHAPEGARRAAVPAGLLVHRAAFKRLEERAEGALELPAEAPGEVPFAFEPIDVVDGAARARAERVLFRSLRKAQDGWTSRWLNRYISLAISRWLVRTPLYPNQVSVGILLVGLAGAALATRGDYWSLVTGAFLFQTQSVLDGCDGEMSRVTYRGSLLGEWLDTIGDDLTNYGFFAGAGLGLHRATGNSLYLVAALVTIAAGALASGLEYRYLLRIGSGDLLKYPLSAAGSADKPGLLPLIQPLFKRDTFVLLTLLAALAGLLGPMLVLFAAGALGILVNVLAAERRMARERAA
ncbi:MAG TPA: CDP-alcohol phosphatidyltransferase family protein [Polyangiaceae bacterium]